MGQERRFELDARNVEIDEAGRVVVNDPELAKALRSADDPHGANHFLDFNCGNKNTDCGCTPPDPDDK